METKEIVKMMRSAASKSLVHKAYNRFVRGEIQLFDLSAGVLLDHTKYKPLSYRAVCRIINEAIMQ